MIATYACCECRTKFNVEIGSSPMGAECKKCGSLYVKWTNYEDFARAFRKENDSPAFGGDKVHASGLQA